MAQPPTQREPSKRDKHPNMALALAIEREGSPELPKRKRKKRRKTGNRDNGDVDDTTFEPSSGSEDTEDDSDEEEIQIIENQETVDILTYKTAPLGKRKRGQTGSQSGPVQDAGVSDGESVAHGASSDDAAPEDQPNKAKRSRVTNKMHLFWEPVKCNEAGEVGTDGDKHYRCYLRDKSGLQKICTISKKMKYSTNGMESYLRHNFPDHYRLFEVLKSRATPPTDEEIAIAQGKAELSATQRAAHVGALSARQTTMEDHLQKRADAQAEPWDQGKFERLLVDWIVATDQPFTTVEEIEFIELLRYLDSRGKMTIPGRNAIARRVVIRTAEAWEETKEVVKNLERVSLTLDAWTSSNQHPFLAIVMTYVAEDGVLGCYILEERLIEFSVIQGAHTGPNMAAIVWKAMLSLGLVGKVIALMLDNAANNDTLVSALADLHKSVGVAFNPKHARLRCMPHTIHLSAVKLLEGIGAFKTSGGRSAVYQEDILAPLAADNTAENIDDAELEDEPIATLPSDHILCAVPKLRHIVKHIRSSPQRRMAWLQTAKEKSGLDLMVILDVATRWSSTHQMIERALKLRAAIATFTQLDENGLREYRLSEVEWNALETVEVWLRVYRSATLQMSTTKRPMLSSVHAMFRGLQDKLRENLQNLPDDCHPTLKAALLAAHKKLSDYYWKVDAESPFYIWSALLDPSIKAEGLEEDCIDEDGVSLADLDQAKASLRAYFNLHYPPKADVPAASSSVPADPHEIDFMDRQRKRPRRIADELTNFWQQAAEPIGVDPIRWWIDHRTDYPRLSRFALALMSIPGSAVAVERVFSGGRDTISLRRASLNSTTIRNLMVLKHFLRLKRRSNSL